MARTVLHVGFHKSASTFLQQTVFRALPVDFGMVGGRLLQALQSPPGSFDAPRARALFARRDPDRPTTVWSNEALSGRPDGRPDRRVECVARNLSTLFPDAKVLIVVRRQPDYLLSYYAYRVAVKGYETRGLPQFLAEESERGIFEHIEYDRLVAMYRRYFPEVHVLPVELLQRSPDVFLQRIFEMLDVPPQPLPHTERRNESPKHLQFLTLCRGANFLFRAVLRTLEFATAKDPKTWPFRSLRLRFYGWKQRLAPRIKPLLGEERRVTFSDAWHRRIEDCFRHANARLQALSGLVLKALGYPLPAEPSSRLEVQGLAQEPR